MNLSIIAKDEISPKLKAVVNALPDVKRNALAAGAAALLNDALREAPTPPIDTGYLRASWAIHVGNKNIKKGSKSNATDRSESDDTATVGFYTPYAKYQHEGVSHSGKPLSPGPKSERAGNTGPKFLESKMIRNKTKYFQVISDGMKSGLQKTLSGGKNTVMSMLGLVE